MYCFIHSQKKVIMDFCTINSTQSCFFFQAKKSRSLFCLVVRRFPGFLNFFKLFFQEALAPWHHFSETQGIGCTAPAKTQFSRKPPGLYRSFPRHPSEYILRWVGVLGCYVFFWVQILNLRSCFWMSRVLNRIFVAKRSSKTTLDAEREFWIPTVESCLTLGKISL